MADAARLDGSAALDNAPLVIDATKQEFNGKRYYLCGRYFQRDGVRLHRVVWESINGPIPDGFHLHHIDGDRSNNHPSNLELLTASAHIAEHGVERAGEYRERWQSGLGERMLELAAEWHASNTGREWHRLHYQRTKDRLHSRSGVTASCEACGVEFEQLRPGNVFCSKACKAKARRLSGIDDEQRTCPVCDAVFTVNRYSRKRCCSRSCGTKLAWRDGRAAG